MTAPQPLVSARFGGPRPAPPCRWPGKPLGATPPCRGPLCCGDSHDMFTTAAPAGQERQGGRWHPTRAAGEHSPRDTDRADVVARIATSPRARCFRRLRARADRWLDRLAAAAFLLSLPALWCVWSLR